MIYYIVIDADGNELYHAKTHIEAEAAIEKARFLCFGDDYTIKVFDSNDIRAPRPK